MKNRILSVSFNTAHFPVSPRTDATIIELDHHVLWMPTGTEPPSSDFSMEMDPQQEEAYVICLPLESDNDVRLEARFLNKDLAVGFDVFNKQGASEGLLTIDTKGYFKQLDQLLKDCSPMEYHEELSLKVRAMRAVFNERISGNDQFWYRFQNDFTNAMAPVRKDPSMTDGDYLVLKTVVPMPTKSVNRAMCVNTPAALQ